MSLKQRVPLLRWSFWRIAAGSRNITTTGQIGDGREAASGLAQKLAVSRPSVTGVVDGLVARGLVRRDPGDGDRRRVDVDLTVAGREVLGQADAAVDQRMERILELLREIQA